MGSQFGEYPSNPLRWEDLRGPAFESLGEIIEKLSGRPSHV